MSRWRRAALAHSHPWRAWLTWRASLTARLRAHAPGFRVEVVRQGLRLPHEDEWREVGAGTRSHVLVREVLLHLRGGPVVMAHSIASVRDLAGPWRSLRGLGSRPLAEALFSDPEVVRAPLEHARLDARHPLHGRACALLGVALPPLWARRSRFTKRGRPLLVTEVFLPRLLDRP